MPQRKIYFRTQKSRKIKIIALAELNFNPTAERLMVDVNLDVEGPVKPRLKPYTTKLNDQLIETCMSEFKRANILQRIKPEHVRLIKSVIYAYETQKEPENTADEES